MTLGACLLLLASAWVADGSQTLANFFIAGASLNMTASSLATAGLPSYSALTLQDAGPYSLGVYECQAGYYSNADAQACTQCGAGKYSESVVASSSSTCISCESGKYSSVLGAASSSSCLNCPNGTYYEGVAGPSLASCLPCPANSTSYPGSKLLQACVCWPGYSGANGEACSPCNASVWCLYGQANPCPPQSRARPISSSLAQCLCVPGYYGDTTMGGPELTLCQVRTHARTRLGCSSGFNRPSGGVGWRAGAFTRRPRHAPGRRFCP